VRTKPQGKQESWLLFKGRDDAADDELDIVSAQPASVLSGRTIDQIATAPGPVWESNRTDGPDLSALLAQLPVKVPLTNLDKELDPSHHLTKGQLIAYLAVVAEQILPHIAGRPLTAVRCPGGSDKPCFFQKHRSPGTPDAIVPLVITEANGDAETYMQIHDLAGLVALGQLGTFEIHTWGSHGDQVEYPDLMVFDLDPDVGLAWDRVALGAFEMRRVLTDLGLESFVKTTGGKGLHVVVPIERTLGWDEVKAFTAAVARRLEHAHPKAYTTNLTKVSRRDKIFVDYLRNGRGATFIAPYSPRARPGMPVAMPIAWDELAAGVDPARFDILTVPAYLDQRAEDPWAEITNVRQSISAAARHQVSLPGMSTRTVPGLGASAK
jgi:bifunctional non-homologous end joining protein LigD